MIHGCPDCAPGIPRDRCDVRKVPTNLGHHHFHSDTCYAPGPGDTEVLVCGLSEPTVITAHVCGGRQARICRATGKEHDMSAVVRFKDGGSVACKDCGVTAIQIDLMELP